MSKKIISFLIIYFIIIDNNIAIALGSPTTNGTILQNFKEKEIANIYEYSNFEGETGETLLQSARNMETFGAIVDSVKEERMELEKQKEYIGQRIDSLEAYIEYLDETIKSTQEEIYNTNSEITIVENNIKDKNIEIAELNEKIKENRKVIFEYINFIYKQTNYSTTDGEMDNLRSILLNGDTIGDTINDLHYKTIIEISGQNLLVQYRGLVKDLYLKTLELQSYEEELSQLRKELIILNSTLDEKRKSKQEVLDQTRGEEDLYKQYIAEKLKVESGFNIKLQESVYEFNKSKQEILNKYGCEEIDIYKESDKLKYASTDCQNVNKLIYAELDLQKETISGENPFEWPVDPKRGITAYYYDADYNRTMGERHEAIDIRVPQGTSVSAPANGYVIYVSEPTTLDYSYVAIKHANGYITVYGHLSEVMVKKYDYIKVRQVFAKSGGEPGTNGAGLMTTGPHLHFEIIKEKKYLDPLKYLDLTYLDFAELATAYRYKFFIDYKNRYGTEYEDNSTVVSTLNITGVNEAERQRSFLAKYAVGDFNDWDMWVNASLDGNIDPTFVMCIGFAESTMGRYTKTANNIGNVGNNDSGDTVTYSSAEQGVKAIVKALNNSYLGQYQTIEKLSRYGNATGPIYASSDFNWHNNVIKCMSTIKQKTVYDDYKFRLSF